MKTKRYKGQTILAPENDQEMWQLYRQVHASRAYAAGYYVIIATLESGDGEPERWSTWTTEPCHDHWTAESMTKALQRGEGNKGKKPSSKMKFYKGNIFDTYEDYARAGGKPMPKAETWDLIKQAYYATRRKRTEGAHQG